MVDALHVAIELRQDETRQGPGRLVGELLRYGQRAGDRAELFEAGALRWPDGGIVLNRQHRRDAPILRFTPILEGDSLRIDALLPDTTAGRDAAAEIRSGLLTSLSIEFRPDAEGRAGGVRVIKRAQLTAAALVDSGSYRGQVDVRAAELDREARRRELREAARWL